MENLAKGLGNVTRLKVHIHVTLLSPTLYAIIQHSRFETEEREYWYIRRFRGGGIKEQKGQMSCRFMMRNLMLCVATDTANYKQKIPIKFVACSSIVEKEIYDSQSRKVWRAGKGASRSHRFQSRWEFCQKHYM